MIKYQPFINGTEEEQIKLIKAENPDADDNSIKEHVKTLNKLFEEVPSRRREAKQPKNSPIMIAIQGTGRTPWLHETIALGVGQDNVSEDAKETLNGIIRDVLKELCRRTKTMKSIKEHELSTKKQSLILPVGTEILNVVYLEDEYKGHIYLYTLENQDQGTETIFREFYVAYKDHEIPFQRGKFINSVVIGNSVAHIFEIMEE